MFSWFLYKIANLAYRDTFTCHSIVVALFFLNASSNISRMALEYTQKHTLFLLIKDTLSDVMVYALILSILFLKRTKLTQSVDKSPK